MAFKPLDENDPVLATLDLGKRLLEQFGLAEKGWKLVIDNSQNRLGQCRHDEKEIGISKYYLHNSAEIEDTIRHEIAHALLGQDAERKSHGWEWQQMAIRVGARPRALAHPSVESSAKPNYQIKCDNCGWKVDRFRMKRRNFHAYCPECHTKVTIYKYVRREGK